jgi:hypothetical protein
VRDDSLNVVKVNFKGLIVFKRNFPELWVDRIGRMNWPNRLLGLADSIGGNNEQLVQVY